MFCVLQSAVRLRWAETVSFDVLCDVLEVLCDVCCEVLRGYEGLQLGPVMCCVMF